MLLCIMFTLCLCNKMYLLSPITSFGGAGVDGTSPLRPCTAEILRPCASNRSQVICSLVVGRWRGVPRAVPLSKAAVPLKKAPQWERLTRFLQGWTRKSMPCRNLCACTQGGTSYASLCFLSSNVYMGRNCHVNPEG